MSTKRPTPRSIPRPTPSTWAPTYPARLAFSCPMSAACEIIACTVRRSPRTVTRDFESPDPCIVRFDPRHAAHGLDHGTETTLRHAPTADRSRGNGPPCLRDGRGFLPCRRHLRVRRKQDRTAFRSVRGCVRFRPWDTGPDFRSALRTGSRPRSPASDPSDRQTDGRLCPWWREIVGIVVAETRAIAGEPTSRGCRRMSTMQACENISAMNGAKRWLGGILSTMRLAEPWCRLGLPGK